MNQYKLKRREPVSPNAVCFYIGKFLEARLRKMYIQIFRMYIHFLHIEEKLKIKFENAISKGKIWEKRVKTSKISACGGLKINRIKEIIV